ncbi:hypothetical protein JTE90_012982 [Oedothorax gibbosus]|uniref:AD domain-containing protein n=1 Tax=Oedothorax gibbosus TaxID=931172 RepID=A0AAV6TN98_9ARAC|nr:hypothetical protein JTE90_012982 [Oedothorax gibbosus]
MIVDPNYTMKFSDCLYKFVSVKTLPKNLVREGWLTTIDPPTGNLVLVTFKDDCYATKQIIFIMRDAYEHVTVLKEADSSITPVLQNLFAPENSLSYINTPERKEQLVSWLKQNRLPIREDENGTALVICESVTIRPPYIADSCSGTNGRVLMLIRDLVDKLPMKN